jgi:hypothetical protein
MSSGGGGKTQTATSTTEPPKYLQPFLQQGMQGAQSLYQQGGQQYYPGQTVVGFSPETEQALGMQTQRAQAGSPVMGAANQFATNTLGGNQPLTFGGGSNPMLDRMYGQAADATQGRLQTEFAGGGRNLGAARPARAEELNNLATSIYGGDYQAERGRMAGELSQNRNMQMGALGMAPGLAQADYADIDRLGQVGQAREDLTGRQYEDAANRWDFGQNSAGTALDQYLSRLQGYPGGVASTSTPIYRNQGAGALGGAMAGYQLGNQFGYGGYGAIAGGLLGAM